VCLPALCLPRHGFRVPMTLATPYEVLLLDRQQMDGVHLVRTVAEFQHAVQ
jgi:hypothetical protein